MARVMHGSGLEISAQSLHKQRLEPTLAPLGWTGPFKGLLRSPSLGKHCDCEETQIVSPCDPAQWPSVCRALCANSPRRTPRVPAPGEPLPSCG